MNAENVRERRLDEVETVNQTLQLISKVEVRTALPDTDRQYKWISKVEVMTALPDTGRQYSGLVKWK